MFSTEAQPVYSTVQSGGEPYGREERKVKRSGCFARIEIYLQPVGTGLAPVRSELHIKSHSRTTAFSASLV